MHFYTHAIKHQQTSDYYLSVLELGIILGGVGGGTCRGEEDRRATRKEIAGTRIVG